MRINKLLSNYGICSRKEANRIIEQNRIIVNGELCTPGQWVEECDEILLDNEKVKPREKKYILLNKPVGVTCTAAKEVENNIISFINYPQYIFPVGRLDKESEGLIILTNDGELANKILESDNQHEKEYIVMVDKPFDDEFIKNMGRGVQLKGDKTRPCKVEKISKNTFKIILTQGINRQIRRMTRAFGYTVTKLKRIRIMNLKIHDIHIGQWRYFTEKELKELKSL
ncbi:pseudouridine synthase [Clostridium massiliodielmoense]|uniref:pseudouridine synthase n=1 Tax=Clostridium massiliodielmoense TaxID=1776385 RepID=UPI0004D6CE4E|nr:pseudouridine synthase [Clostridium massiliodielmoense]KEH92917.1 pseudouridine synthase [Clostridium botulinum C/D str. BKT12695]